MRYLGLHKHSHEHWLQLMSQSKYRHYDTDSYNEGPLIDELETRVAALLGKPDAMYFNKGTTCQMAALKVHCEDQQNTRVMLHPQSHIVADEADAYQALMGLQGVMVGAVDRPLTVADISHVSEPVAALVIELPLRRAGFKLADWNELKKIRRWCDQNQVKLHMDGARLWESAPHYGHAWAGIARLFDSVYVSLYKGIGALSGAVLAADNDFLGRCQVWRDRLGSNLWSTFPALITALEGFDRNLPQISQWVARAREIANALQDIEALQVDNPHTNGFQVRLNGDLYPINNKLKALCRSHDMQPCKPFTPVPDSDLLYTEIQVGRDHAAIKTFELVDFFTALINPEAIAT